MREIFRNHTVRIGKGKLGFGKRNTVLLLVLTAPARAEIQPEFMMNSDPRIEAPAPIKNFGKRLAPLWMLALSRPEQDLQRKAAESIAHAHRAEWRPPHRGVSSPGHEETLGD